MCPYVREPKFSSTATSGSWTWASPLLFCRWNCSYRPSGLGLVAQWVLSVTHACTDTLPWGHQQTTVSTCSILEAWDLTTSHPRQEICVHKRSLPHQRPPLCPEVFCWSKEQMWCRQQQCQLPPASPSTHLEGAAGQEEEVVQPYCFFLSSAF